MPVLPPSSEITSATRTNLQMKQTQSDVREFIAGILGADGTVATALDTIGALAGSYVARNSAYTVTLSDRGQLINAASGTWTLTLPAVATAGAGFSIILDNNGSGVITIDPSGAELIDGAATLALEAGRAALLVCTGAQWVAVMFAGVVQASATDATAGRLLMNRANGAFGLGATSQQNAWPNTSIDDVTGVGAGFYTSVGANTELPPGGVGWLWLSRRVTGSGQFLQTAFTLGTGIMWRRVATGGTEAAPTWNAWRQVFDQTNILAAVSQSGGVPTGGVIERGSNANGEYVRFADGTQICARLNLSAANASTALGSIFRSADVAWTYPAAFVAAPLVTGDVDDADAWLTANTRTTTTCNLRALAGATKAGALNLCAFAYGRWF